MESIYIFSRDRSLYCSSEREREREKSDKYNIYASFILFTSVYKFLKTKNGIKVKYSQFSNEPHSTEPYIYIVLIDIWRLNVL